MKAHNHFIGREHKIVVFGKNKYKVTLAAFICGEDIVAIIGGGEKPHVGAVAVAIPHPSHKDSKISCTSSVFTLFGHKDDVVARPISERIATQLNKTTVVIAGLHIEKASKKDINKLVSNSMRCAEKMLEEIKKALR
ncbi:MAG: hypothetical protein QXR45_10305 [Candidatus Bathyarchaeia archaeon]